MKQKAKRKNAPVLLAGTFEWALVQMKNGSTITKDERVVGSANQTFRLGGDNLCFFEEDLTATDWRIVEPQP